MQHLYEYGAIPFEDFGELIDEMQAERDRLVMPVHAGLIHVFAAFR